MREVRADVLWKYQVAQGAGGPDYVPADRKSVGGRIVQRKDPGIVDGVIDGPISHGTSDQDSSQEQRRVRHMRHWRRTRRSRGLRSLRQLAGANSAGPTCSWFSRIHFNVSSKTALGLRAGFQPQSDSILRWSVT